jgi:hypothetical protein
MTSYKGKRSEKYDFFKAQLLKVVLSFEESVKEELKGNFDKAQKAFKTAEIAIEQVNIISNNYDIENRNH